MASTNATAGTGDPGDAQDVGERRHPANSPAHPLAQDAYLVRYDAACRAIAEARAVDEVKEILDLAAATTEYARRAKNLQMEADAVEIRMRATRRLDELIKAQAATVGLAQGTRGSKIKGARVDDKPTLAEAGIDKNLAHQARVLGALDDGDFADKIAEARSSVSRVQRRVIREIEIEKERAARRANAIPLPDGADLRIGDCRGVLADIADNSVPLILTDPPYGDEAEPLYRWLAEFSARVLVPGGSLICFTGQSRLNRDIKIFDGHLRYWWQLKMDHTQPQRFPGKFVIATFKPILWYVKEFRGGRSLIVDTLNSSRRDKVDHDWGQGEAGVGPLIEHLTEPGELIVDPFAGTATWGRIAASMGRRWIGADIEEGGTTNIEAEPLSEAAE
jgi:hypothetical protein